VAGGKPTNRAFALTCSTRDMPTSAVVIPGDDRTNCNARSGSFRSPNASATNPGSSSPPVLQQRGAGNQRDVQFARCFHRRPVAPAHRLIAQRQCFRSCPG